MPAPIFLVAGPLLAGAAAAVLGHGSLGPDLPLLAALASLVAFVSAAGFIGSDDRVGACAAVAVAALAAGLSLGASAAAQALERPLLAWFANGPRTEPIVLEGVLREDASPGASGPALTIDVVAVDGRRGADGRPLGGVRATVAGSPGEGAVRLWRAGRTIRAPVLLRRPSTFLNPGTPDERPALARRGIVLVGTVKSAALVEVVRPGSVLQESAASIRAWARQRLSRHLAPRSGRSAAVTTAVLIGDRSALPPDDERRLRDAGTYHVIAISGGNIAVLACVLVGAARVLMLGPALSASLCAAALVFYGAVAGGAASVTRAVTVAVLVLAARGIDHRAAPVNILGTAAISIVCASPVLILDAGFLLSFGATAGIVLGVPALSGRAGATAKNSRRARRLAYRAGAALGALCAATLCAELMLVPIAASLFGRLPLAGLLLNCAAIPLMTVVQIGGLATLAASGWLDPAADAAAAITHAAAAGLLGSARLVDAAPWLAVDVRPPAPWLVAVHYAAAAVLLAGRRRWGAGAAIAGCIALMVAGPAFAARDAVPLSPVPLRVVVLDVGQGDATAVLLPHGRALLVDAGGSVAFGGSSPAAQPPAFDVGERVVSPALAALGVRRLTAAILTHGDPDHALGLPGVLRRVPAAAVWEGVPVPPHAGLQALRDLASRTRMTWRTVQPGDIDRFGEVEVRVLHPPAPDWERQRVRNDDSIVLDIRIGRVSMLLPGDIGKEGEAAILNRLEPGRLVILKAPHHGSATSSTPALIAATRPAAVVFSCGRDNRFGHPHPSVLARYRTAGTPVFSTMADGAVLVETDGQRVLMRGWTGRALVIGETGG